MKRMVTLWYDEDSGELLPVRSAFSPTFQAEDRLMQADVLKDAIGLLTTAYEQAAGEAFAGIYLAVVDAGEPQ